MNREADPAVWNMGEKYNRRNSIKLGKDTINEIKNKMGDKNQYNGEG